MKREIKFRAWDGSKMIYVNDNRFLRLFDDGSGAIVFAAKDEFEMCSIGNGNATLMQYTGLNDKNGIEIYEGDMINAWDDSFTEMGRNKISGIIEYYENAFMLKSDKNVYSHYWPSAEEIEVIGNIYENPELLKKGLIKTT